NRNRTLIKLGESSGGGQPANLVRTLYDERDLKFRVIRAEADPQQSTTQLDYDGNGNLAVVRTGLESAPRIFNTTFDGFDRPVVVQDPMGNITRLSYDANRNRVHSRIDGELIDSPGVAANVRIYERSDLYDE